MWKDTDCTDNFMYCIHAGWTTSGTVSLDEIIIFLPKLR